MKVDVTNYGGRIVSIWVPDKNGTMQDVVLVFDDLGDYQTVPTDFGATIGRYANRINQGIIVIDGDSIQLPQNNLGHCLHSGTTLEMYTDEPGVQIYTGNFLDGTVKGKKGIVYPQRASVCLETQHYPDSPNKPHWSSVILEPGQTYRSHCIYKFGVE